MSIRHYYEPGGFLRICDISGFTVRAKDTKKQWNNYIVRRDFWEPRNSQDFVRGRRDEQASYDPRPRQLPFAFSGENTTLAQLAPTLTRTIVLAAPIGLVVGTEITILLDSGDIFYDTVVGAGGDFSADFSADFSLGPVVLAEPLPYHAAAGNAVVNVSYVAVQPQNYPRAS